MGLQYQSPRQVAQAIRMRTRALAGSRPLIVVESHRDRRALLPFLDPDVVVIPGQNKDLVVQARALLADEQLGGVLYLIDCDAGCTTELKGHHDLVISQNRDIEADLIFELDALFRVACEFMEAESRSAAEDEAERLVETAATVTCLVGEVRDAARDLDLPVRPVDRHSGSRRAIRLEDLHSARTWLAGHEHSPSLSEVAADFSTALGWTMTDADAVSTAAVRLADAECGAHASSGCTPCRFRSRCNGHHLVEAVATLISELHGSRVEDSNFDRLLRTSSRSESLSSWEVALRIQRWEAKSGLVVLSR